jgi:hypothetical protein
MQEAWNYINYKVFYCLVSDSITSKEWKILQSDVCNFSFEFFFFY